MTPGAARARRRRIRPPAVPVVWALAIMLAGALAACGNEGPDPGDPVPLQVQDADHVRSVVAEEIADRRAQVIAGMRVEIPTIGVSTPPLIPLGLNEDRTMEVPADFDVVGWYRYSPTPGENGPAVLAGHVDSHSGPAVFFRLADLRPGDEVRVHGADGPRTFTVDRVEQHPKDAFPHDAVYGDTETPELRLITCGGVFDRAERSHRDNIIVYASLAG